MSKIMSEDKTRKGWEISGRMVFAMLIAFFGVIMTVNAIMAHYAISTFAGLETESSYKAGLAFRSEGDAAERQEALGWSVDVSMAPPAAGDERRIVVEVRDKAGNALNGLDIQARMLHPTDARQDATVQLVGLGRGRYGGEAVAHAGQWDLQLDLTQGGERKFRSRNRIVVK